MGKVVLFSADAQPPLPGPWSLSAAPWGWALRLRILSSAAVAQAQCPRARSRGQNRTRYSCVLSAFRETILLTLRICWNHREQQIRFVLPTGVDRIRSGVVVGG